MNLQVEILETHEARMTIGVDASDVEKARRDVAREMSKQVRIPGFRPGHAPTAAVVRAMGGEEAFMAEVTNKLANDLYPAALDEAKIEPYGPGRIDDLKAEPFALIAVVPLEPVIDLKEYKSIRLPAPEVSIDEAELQEQLSYIKGSPYSSLAELWPRRVEVILHDGDAILIPAKWLHCTDILSFSVALNWWFPIDAQVDADPQFVGA